MITYTVTVEVDGTRAWKVGDKLHRLDGPAYEHVNGTKFWWVDGKLHRLDGPACEWKNGYKEWYIDGVKLTETEFLNRTKKKTSCAEKVVEVDGKRYKLVEA